MATKSPPDVVAIKSYDKASSEKVSPNFTAGEFRCRCEGSCNVTLISMELVGLLERIRAELPKYGGKSLKINSGYRCAKHNESIGGVKNSMHTKGLAADIVAPGLEPELVAVIASTVNPEGGVGSYEKFTHVDARGKRARW